MTDPNYQYDQTVIMDLVDDTVVADTDAIQIFRAGELLDAFGSRLSAQPVQGANEADLIVSREL